MKSSVSCVRLKRRSSRPEPCPLIWATYTNGGTRFLIDGTQFPSRPILKIVSPTDNENIFPFVSQVGNVYTYTTPQAPPIVGNTGSKKRPSTESYTFKIFFGLNEFRSEPFSYIQPTISSFSPFDTQVLQSGGRPTGINGDGFQLEQNEQFPSVYFGNVQANVISVRPGRITVNVPDVPFATAVEVTLIMYSGLHVPSAIQFTFVAPVLISITPTEGISGVAHSVLLTGINLVDGNDQIMSRINIGPDVCSNVQLISADKVRCTTVPKIIPPGQSIPLDVQMSIHMQVQSNLKFTFYNPQIETVTPDSGPLTGGTRVKVTGTYLGRLSRVVIGGAICNIDNPTVTVTEFYCTTTPIQLAQGVTEATFPLQATIEAQVISSPNNQLFKYFVPVITSISPSRIMSKDKIIGLEIQGRNLESVNKITFGGVDLNVVKSPTNTDTKISGDIDVTGRPIGDITITVSSGIARSNPFVIKMLEPKIRLPTTPNEAYRYSITPIVIDVENFPLIPATASIDDIRERVKIKIGTKPCTDLLKVNDIQYSCTVPRGAVTGPVPITFTLNEQEYLSDKVFNYYAVTQTDEAPVGGGRVQITGTRLSLVDGVQIGGEALVMTTCTVTAVRVECTMPSKRPGSYDLVLMVGTREFASATQVTYTGPQLDRISPKQGNRKRSFRVTLHGDYFGNDRNDIDVTINGLPCTDVKIVEEDIEITCKKPIDVAGVHNVVVVVDNGAGHVASMDTVTFTNNGLSCLGLPDDRDGSNGPVNWWLTYKVKGTLHSSRYLYQDNTMSSLLNLDGLSNFEDGEDHYSPLAATYDQYNDYNYLFFNDQPGSRGSNGERSATQSTGSSHGHVKGFVIFEETANGIEGIHVLHSNPHFPAYYHNGYYQVNSGLRWLGSPEYNQHFFCYKFSSIDDVALYFLKTDANLQNTYKAPVMGNWPEAKKNQYPHFYDLMTAYNGRQRRVPGPNDPPVTSAETYKADCQASIANEEDLDAICYWTLPFDLDGATAHLFMKTSLMNVKKARFPKARRVRPDGLSRYVVVKPNTKEYEGVDLWQVIAGTYQRKMFIEFFYAISMRQLDTSEEILNVGALHLPPRLAIESDPDENGQVTFSGFEYFGKKNEHANDLTSRFSALRTTRSPNRVGVENSLVENPPILPNQPDIRLFTADDVFSLHYQAYDDKIAFICDPRPTFTDGTELCDARTSRTTILEEDIDDSDSEDEFPPKLPFDYTPAYADIQRLRTFNLVDHHDFQIIKFAKALRAKLSLTPDVLYRFQYVIDPTITKSHFDPPFIYLKSDQLCGEELAYLSLLSYTYSEPGLDPSTILWNMGDDAPNWANGILLALSKKIYNEIEPIAGKTTVFDQCFTLFPLFRDIRTYSEALPWNYVNPTVEQLFYRSAAAAWDMMDKGSIGDGKGGRVKRTTEDDVITYRILLDQIMAIGTGEGVNSLLDIIIKKVIPLYPKVKTLATAQVFVNRYIKAPPKPVVVNQNIVVNNNNFKVLKSSRTLLSIGPAIVDPPDNSLPLVITDPDLIVPPIIQLINHSPTFDPLLLDDLADDEVTRLEDALNKWVTIQGVNQGLQVLLYDPASQTVDQPIKFIDEINRDTFGSDIDLCYEELSPTETKIQVCDPMSLVSLTFFLESAIASEGTPLSTVGDIDYYFVNKPFGYSGYISDNVQGMVVATVNSQLCDIRMVNSDAILTSSFDAICLRAGPMITSMSVNHGPTTGTVIDFTGTRFSPEMTMRIGPYNCNFLGISPTVINCLMPGGIGADLSVNLFHRSQNYFYNLQRTKYTFSFDPDARNLLALSGDGFGDPDYDDKPAVFMDNQLLEVTNFTDNLVWVRLAQSVGPHFMTMNVTNGYPHPNYRFIYYPPYAQQFDFTRLKPTGGGMLVIKGYGWGLSALAIDYIRLGGLDLLNCRPFNTFVECSVPVQADLMMPFKASVSGQLAELSGTLQPVFKPPVVTGYSFESAPAPNYWVVIRGRNFLPFGPLNPETTYARIIIPNQPEVICRNFINSTTLRCLVNSDNVIGMNVIVNRVSSNNFPRYIWPLVGTVFNEIVNDRIWGGPNELPQANRDVYLVPVLPSTEAIQQTKSDANGVYRFQFVKTGLYQISVTPAPNQFTIIKYLSLNVDRALTFNLPVFNNNKPCFAQWMTQSGLPVFVNAGRFQLNAYGLCMSGCPDPIVATPLPPPCRVTFEGPNVATITII
eukprot:gene13670-16098_t